MATPRKTAPARKAPARKAPTAEAIAAVIDDAEFENPELGDVDDVNDPDDEDEDEDAFGEAFTRFRLRANRNRAARRATKVNRIPDYVLGPDDGFDPEIRVKFPLPLQQQDAYYAEARAGSIFGQVRAVLGGANYARLLLAMDSQDDPTTLFYGFAAELFEHIDGPGADDVPGGPRRSSR